MPYETKDEKERVAQFYDFIEEEESKAGDNERTSHPTKKHVEFEESDESSSATSDEHEETETDLSDQNNLQV